jgi:hypothetical protein
VRSFSVPPSKCQYSTLNEAITTYFHNPANLLFIIIHSFNAVKKKGKAIPATGHGGPQGSETSRLPHFVDNQLTDGGEIVKPYTPAEQPPFPPPGRFLVLISVRG